MSTHFLGHQSSGFGFVTSLSATGQVKLNDPQDSISCSFQPYLLRFAATLVEIAAELGDQPFGQLIPFRVLPLASSHFGSLGGTALLRGTDRELADCSFPRLLIHFLQGFAYWNEGQFMPFR
uniref:Uncharacterized protein n=1 Tax=Solanum tuberosum TaxID=4113 RepID=M1DCQ8_SOLTU